MKNKTDDKDKVITRLLYIALGVVVFGIYYSIFELVKNRDNRIDNDARIECIKDSLYNEYVTDKLNKQ